MAEPETNYMAQFLLVQEWSITNVTTTDGSGSWAYPMRPVWTGKYLPEFNPEKDDDYWWSYASIPTFSFIANTTSIDEINYATLVIQMKKPKDHATIDALHNALFLANEDSTVKSTYVQLASSSKIKTILDKVFYGLISVTMFLCFFSLCASMSANLYEQKKEVGIIRAMGFTKYRVRMLYFYESLVLVLTSCILGVLIGTVVGYTMLLQFNLFLNANVQPFFPWGQFILVVVLSLFCAFFSTWGPAAQLTNRSISSIFRLV